MQTNKHVSLEDKFCSHASFLPHKVSLLLVYRLWCSHQNMCYLKCLSSFSFPTTTHPETPFKHVFLQLILLTPCGWTRCPSMLFFANNQGEKVMYFQCKFNQLLLILEILANFSMSKNNNNNNKIIIKKPQFPTLNPFLKKHLLYLFDFMINSFN